MEHFDKIEQLARELHGDQKRKYTGDPYVNHTVAVANIVKTYGGDESMVYAAILHDVLEDTPTSGTELLNYLMEITDEPELSIGHLGWLENLLTFILQNLILMSIEREEKNWRR